MTICLWVFLFPQERAGFISEVEVKVQHTGGSRTTYSTTRGRGTTALYSSTPDVRVLYGVRADMQASTGTEY